MLTLCALLNVCQLNQQQSLLTYNNGYVMYCITQQAKVNYKKITPIKITSTALEYLTVSHANPSTPDFYSFYYVGRYRGI